MPLIRKSVVMQLKAGKEEEYRASHNEGFWRVMRAAFIVLEALVDPKMCSCGLEHWYLSALFDVPWRTLIMQCS